MCGAFGHRLIERTDEQLLAQAMPNRRIRMHGRSMAATAMRRMCRAWRMCSKRPTTRMADYLREHTTKLLNDVLHHLQQP